MLFTWPHATLHTRGQIEQSTTYVTAVSAFWQVPIVPMTALKAAGHVHHVGSC